MIRREEFTQRKQAAEELQLARLNTKAKRMASAGKKFDGLPVLQVFDNAIAYIPAAAERKRLCIHEMACNALVHSSLTLESETRVGRNGEE